jgi:hypothetical protein
MNFNIPSSKKFDETNSNEFFILNETLENY